MINYIPNMDLTEQQKNELNLLAQLEEPLYLTGSRFFETEHDESDIDYMISSNTIVTQHLIENGFKSVFNADEAYGSSDLTNILQSESGLFHIQFTRKLDKKLLIQNFIKGRDLQSILYTINKDDRKRLWDAFLFLKR